ncbi:hypothetical protein [Paenibacillus agricola]|uniref:hypothetical protein n=1 Tax=Paenibacillus agricola TaxID=2716264 RepID=UPI001A9ECE0B|nr:hypothetical protein [Paenibacillus agricola]
MKIWIAGISSTKNGIGILQSNQFAVVIDKNRQLLSQTLNRNPLVTEEFLRQIQTTTVNYYAENDRSSYAVISMEIEA